ncbi:MAG: IS630 family transposase [Betaproteobacteria bacterium]
MKKIDARSLPRDAQDEMRRQAIRMREQLKMTWAEIAKVVGVSETTAWGWGKRYLSEGEGGLVSRTRGRRHLSGRTLSLVQEWVIRSVITSGYPDQLKLPFALWNRRAVMELIAQKFGIQMPIRTVGMYLQRWGYTPQRPIKRAAEQDPRRVAEWLRTEYPKIANRAKTEGALVYWGDETAVAEDGHWIRGYAPMGKTPVLTAPTKRHGLTMISAISNQGLVRFEFMQGAINVESLIEFMGKLISDSDRKVFLILDNLRVHHAKAVKEWVSERSKQIEIFFLPPYSPEINPDEYLNRELKTRLRLSERSKTKSGLLRKAEDFMSFLLKTPSRIQSYFSHPAVRYAN